MAVPVRSLSSASRRLDAAGPTLEAEFATVPLTPEQRVGKRVDGQRDACGWKIHDFASVEIYAGRGVEVREYPLKCGVGADIKSGFAANLLYAEGCAIGVIEAKPARHTLQGVLTR